ncbi:methyltransferase domain-containing protein [Maridesulfovibrio sp.]|uniref:methyltransferase domain-containing protein n=1 Tax=Maridesulfovibrio sp. TaxID=2795000 RepID=UPI002AA7D411|nr:methyltransferase domain-containing protein [Maridesulfovibrio sp.]
MYIEHIKLLCCPECKNKLEHINFESSSSAKEIHDGVLYCKACNEWYPIEHGVADLLTGPLAYQSKLDSFWEKHKDRLKSVNLQQRKQSESNNTGNELELEQQRHSDWFADNEEQTYTEFSEQTTWTCADEIVLEEWKDEISDNTNILEIGCAQGRFTKYFYSQPSKIIGFDLSTKLLQTANATYQQLKLEGKVKAEVSFMAANALAIPVQTESFDLALCYGVLHHVPSPEDVCSEISRALKKGGVFLGSENNKTIFRFVFDLMMLLFPLWKEEAGPEALISKSNIKKWLTKNSLSVKSYTYFYFPPHLINMMGHKKALQLLKATDFVASKIPFIKDNGGLIRFKGVKD